MVEKTKANQGASVSKAGNMGGQSSLPKTKSQWDQGGTLEACQNNSPPNHASEADPPSQATLISSRAKKPAAKQEISEQIGRQLRSVYNDVLAQPVPDRFLDLLRALEKDPK